MSARKNQNPIPPWERIAVTEGFTSGMFANSLRASYHEMCHKTQKSPASVSQRG